MSVKIMGLVWEADLPQREKFVLLAYADHADHEGNNVFPSIGLIAWKTGYSSRSIQRITKDMVDRGILVEQGQHDKYGTNKYRIAIEALPKLSPYGRGVKLSPSTYGGDILSGGKSNGGDKPSSRGDKMPVGGDTAVSPEPSFKPSVKPSEREAPNFREMELPQILKIPEIATYREVTGRIPGQAQYEVIWETIGTHGFTVDYLRPFWKEWAGNRGYRPNNNSWLTDWAVSGEIPDGKPSKSDDKPLADQILEDGYEYRRAD